ncbi:MAG: PQQ-binding-like beta-propeller repeat protein [Myxococcales bacterium]|nr:PQQ-binding-like beta-propeller repeat protein [Myxococcales bacterium]
MILRSGGDRAPVSRLVAPFAVVLAFLSACGGGAADLDHIDFLSSAGRSAGLGPVRLRWNRRLVPTFEGAYLPVERAVPALDPGSNRVYAGSTAGTFYAFDPAGRSIYRYSTGAGIESEAALDPARDELYLGTDDGQLHALVASSGKVRWKGNAEGPLRSLPVLTDDAVYVATDTDKVIAFARDDGTVLWRYGRAAPETMSIAGHAGLLIHERHIITGFTDGTVAALQLSDGSVEWLRDTSIDVNPEDLRAPRYVDVDTTPLLVDGVLWVASFAGGLYGLAPSSGSVLWHDSERTGIVGMTEARDMVIVSSGDEGLAALTRDDRRVIWSHEAERGGYGLPVVIGDTILVAEDRGPFVSMDLFSGEETGRIETGFGFAARAAVAGGLGFILSNGGTLLAFSI